jgi:subtilisin family serine protease
MLVLLCCALSLPALAANRFILRPASGGNVSDVAGRHGLTVLGALDSASTVYSVVASDMLTPTSVISDCSGDSGITHIEQDQATLLPERNASALLNQSTTAILDQLHTHVMTTWFGQQVPQYYAVQTAVSQIHLDQAQNNFGASGVGTVVAIIDTGIDPNHPVLAASVVPGYDFTRNVAGIPNELADVSTATAAALTQSTTAILDQRNLAILNQSTTAILDQSTTAILDQSTTAILDHLPEAFGHGTMVAGVIHLAAPKAQLMPLKAFAANGTGELSDILRAIYYAIDHGANVINMSFSLDSSSTELVNAIGLAQNKNVITVASTGNTGLGTVAFPAALQKVIGVASVDGSGNRSAFSSFGTGTWIAAPGEEVITTYPGGHYAAASGTSFSAPLISGGSALVKQFMPTANYSNVSAGLACNRKLSADMGYGVADLSQTVQWAAKNVTGSTSGSGGTSGGSGSTSGGSTASTAKTAIVLKH